jgi:phosphatidylglycerol:prolipoprotein diacylglycerol transferase
MIGALSFPNINPEIFAIEVFGFNLALRWYALAYIVGIAIGWQIMAALLRRVVLWRDETPPMEKSKLEDLLTYLVVGGIGGGRLGYVFFSRADYYLQNPIEIPMIWTGGMSFHGGFIGVFLAVMLFSYRHKVAFGSLADLVCLTATPVILLVRCANFINGELWGRATDVPWGVIFPSAAAQDCPGVNLLCARHPSQLYEAGLEGLVLGILLLILVFRFGILKFPLLLSGAFFLGYGLIRFSIEFLRQPDAQFQSLNNPLGWALDFGEWGLTMGQILSSPMIIGGLLILIVARRRA